MAMSWSTGTDIDTYTFFLNPKLHPTFFNKNYHYQGLKLEIIQRYFLFFAPYKELSVSQYFYGLIELYTNVISKT